MVRVARSTASKNKASTSRISGVSSDAGAVRAMPTSISAKSGVVPAGQGSPTGHTGGATVDHRLYVVERAIREAGRVDSARIVEPMLGRIPAPYGDIETAAKRDCVVHHHDFLMMRRASGQIFVQTKANAPRRAPTEGKGRERLAFERVKHRVVPHQEMHRELRPLIDERGQ